jgi:hypothetical protein
MPFDLRDLANSVAAALGQGSVLPGAPQRLWQDTQAFALRLLSTATQQWLPFYMRQEPCHVMQLRARVAFPCGAASILVCDVCQKPACLNHAQVDQHGHGTCYACVAEMINLKRGVGAPPPGASAAAGADPREVERAARVKAAFKELDLDPKSSWEEVQARHRKLAAKYHPDRARTVATKSKAAQKSVAINSAFAELKKHFGERAA